MRDVGIITTASLPWLTGTSIIPLFQAVYLKRRGVDVTLYLPWLPPRHQHYCFRDHRFEAQEEQICCIRHWLPESLRSACPAIRFYPAVYAKPIESIGPTINPDRLMANHDAIVLIDPEHLFAPHPWARIKQRRKHVTGIVMTHYEFYHGTHIPLVLAKLYQHYSRFLMRRMCHQLIALAPVQPDVCALSSCRVIPLNAADPRFFETGLPASRSGCYFMGKLIPEKGLQELFENLQRAGEERIDVFGCGQEDWARRMAARYHVKPVFKGLTYQPWQDLACYRIFVNCSRSEYLCSTTAQALVMQQWVIVPKHPSNHYYATFKNCLVYQTEEEFVACYQHACTNLPHHDTHIRLLSWESVVEKLASEIGLV